MRDGSQVTSCNLFDSIPSPLTPTMYGYACLLERVSHWGLETVPKCNFLNWPGLHWLTSRLTPRAGDRRQTDRSKLYEFMIHLLVNSARPTGNPGYVPSLGLDRSSCFQVFPTRYDSQMPATTLSLRDLCKLKP